jgi:LysM repeat protein
MTGPACLLLVVAIVLAPAPGPGLAGADGAGKKGKAKKEPPPSAGKVLVWLRVGKVTSKGVLVTVQPGQRLQDIADTYGVSIQTLVSANSGLDPGSIWSGQKILVPDATKVLAVKTWVPEDKLDEIPGMKDADDEAVKKPGKKGQSKSAKPDDGWEMVKSGKVSSPGVWHTIQPGQNLGMIAAAYGVGVAQIVKATGLANPDAVKVGQKVLVPGATAVVAVKARPTKDQDLVEEHAVKSGKVVKAGVMHIVQPGQTLSIIATAYETSVSSILKANGISNADSIKLGQKILVPGAKQVVAVQALPGKALAMPTKITFHRIHTGETKTITLYSSTGKLVPGEYAKFEKMMYDHHTGKKHKIHPRLCYMLKLVAENWPGKVITIYSGYRAYNPSQYTKKSKHNLGRAIDFSVDGVSNLKLMKFCRTLENVGVGYYPNSYFVHMDVRETSSFWVDYAGPGEAPKYKKWKQGKGGDEDVNLEADSDAADVDVKKK